MELNKQLRNAKRATQLIFLICGLGLASWAPMVPFVKDRLGIHEGDLGMLLLSLGLGAIIMMPVSGYLIHKIGSAKVMFAGAVLAAVMLPLLLIVPGYFGMVITLFAFGCGVGSVDVAMNAHGVQVQNLYGKPIMSSLHGLFSVGGLVGSLGLGLLIKMGLNPLHAATVIAISLIVLMVSQYRKLFNYQFEKKTVDQFSNVQSEVMPKNKFAWLHKTVLLIGFMCFSVFLAEGAMLDWSAVFLRDLKQVSTEFAGLGYALFSIAMAAMRLMGDKIVEKTDSRFIVVGGSLIAVSGFILMITATWLPLVLLGFVLLGIGSSNIVPIFFSEAGRISGVSATTAVSAITTMGYAGQLAGPALLGFIAHHFSLYIAFAIIAVLMFLVAVIYGFRSVNKLKLAC